MLYQTKGYSYINLRKRRTMENKSCNICVIVFKILSNSYKEREGKKRKHTSKNENLDKTNYFDLLNISRLHR